MPCKPRKQSMLSNYAQQERYWRMKGKEKCAKKKCREDLIKFILESRIKEERVILMIDGNENMRTGALAKRLKQRDINMRDSIWDKVGSQKFPTWFRGQ